MYYRFSAMYKFLYISIIIIIIRGRGDQVKKSWKFQGVGGSNLKPSGTENPGGWGLKL